MLQRENIESREVILLDGTPGIIRQIQPSDREALKEAFRELSEESRFRRFFFQKSTLTEQELEWLATPDGHKHLAYGLAVTDEETGGEEPISIAHCFRSCQESDLGEIALVTADLWQGNGAGYELLKTLSAASFEVGIERWSASLLSDNKPMFRLLSKVAELESKTAEVGGVSEVIYRLKK